MNAHEYTSRTWPMVIVGGGPASAIQVQGGGVPAEDILLISDRWGTGMDFMAEAYLQSYVEELAITADDSFLNITTGALQPTAVEYGKYVRQNLFSSGATLAEGRITNLTWVRDHFELQVAGPDAPSAVVRAEQVVLATGARARRPPQIWADAGALTFDRIYRMSPTERRARFAGRRAVVVGSGNSAMQVAALAAPLATDTLILATRYQGMYPFETQDRFAWRSHSALTCELVVKSATTCRSSAVPATCVRFLIYRDLRLNGATLEVEYRQADNDNVLGSHSLPDRCAHAVAEVASPLRPRRPGASGHWRERRDLAETVLIWATGSEPVYPPSPLLDEAGRDDIGNIRCDGAGRTDVPGLYLIGACSGRRSVNEMQPALAVSVEPIR
jgi:thioredoxin reductase